MPIPRRAAAVTRPSPRPYRAAAVAVAAVAQLVAGCYSQVPVRWDALPQNKEVEVALDVTRTASLAADLGPRAQQLEGRVAGRTDSTLTVAVTAITRTSGVAESWPGSEVVLPASAIERVTVRKLSAVRSAIVAAAIVGGGTLLGAAVGGPSSQPGGRNGGGGGQAQ